MTLHARRAHAGDREAARPPRRTASPAERDAFGLGQRPPRPALDPWAHQGVLVEPEVAASGQIVDVATVFLTGRECPWRCAMCDLWRHTTADDTPAGALPHQVRAALASVGDETGRVPPHVKLYNAGSFFDPRAVPRGDYDAIAREISACSHVIVESHPALIGPPVDAWVASLARARSAIRPPTSLEVAMGLETVHPDALEQLNKRMTADGFARAAEGLARRGVLLRAFLLVNPPFVPRGAQDEWLARSVDFAFDCGASVVSLIPTRPGNGAMDRLAEVGTFVPPTLNDVERSFEAALARAAGRVFVDVWDLERCARCSTCLPARRERLREMNLRQAALPHVNCAHCGHAA